MRFGRFFTFFRFDYVSLVHYGNKWGVTRTFINQKIVFFESTPKEKERDFRPVFELKKDDFDRFYAYFRFIYVRLVHYGNKWGVKRTFAKQKKIFLC